MILAISVTSLDNVLFFGSSAVILFLDASGISTTLTPFGNFLCTSGDHNLQPCVVSGARCSGLALKWQRSGFGRARCPFHID